MCTSTMYCSAMYWCAMRLNVVWWILTHGCTHFGTHTCICKHMCRCACACAYVCVHVCVCIQVCLCTFICMDVCVCICVCARTYMCVHTRCVGVYVCMWACMHECIHDIDQSLKHTWLHACAFAHTHVWNIAFIHGAWLWVCTSLCVRERVCAGMLIIHVYTHAHTIVYMYVHEHFICVYTGIAGIYVYMQVHVSM